MDELIVGTYEGFLLGYSIHSEETSTKLKQTFATHSHTAAVRCVSIAGKYLASGGTDDKVVIIDLKSRKEHTVLMNHDGTINTVAFTNGGTHLLSGSDDGTIVVTRTGNWQVEKIWKKCHSGQAVTNIAVHPSDKLALSVGGDKTLKTWNLVKGRSAFTMNLASKDVLLPSEIKFSPGGDRFSLVSQQTVDVWTISKAGLEKRITCTSKPTTLQWVDDERIIVGLGNGNIITLTISDTQAQTYQAHKQRVKCLYYDSEILYSASSSGELKVWSVSGSVLKEICSHNAACRVTCVALNKQNLLIKKEDECSEDVDNQEAFDDKGQSDDEIRVENDHPPLLKRKPGAFVSISYEDHVGKNNNETSPPHSKKIKKRKRKQKANKIIN